MISLLGLNIVFISILIIVVVQLIMTFRIWGKVKQLNAKFDPLTQETPETEKVEDKPNVTAVQSPEKETEKETTHIAPMPTKTPKERAIEAVLTIKEAEVEDLPSIMKELKSYFSNYKNEDYTKDLSSKDYFRFIDLRNTPETRVVVIGDIHSDYNSLVAALLKLSVSDYNYFEKAIFVFLGDYLDRGSVLFEPLLLLKRLKEILGDRLIMLKGNHESVLYDKEKQQITTKVTPNQSCMCLNEYCAKDQEFIRLFASFYNTLPIYVYLKTMEKNVLLTHAAIPRDKFLDSIHFDDTSGCIIFESDVPMTERLKIRNTILKDMIWGDPSEYDEKIQTEGRFEFGSKQFERFARLNHISLLFRSHEEVPKGYKSFYGNRLYTIFSTGSHENSQTGYPSVEPAFAVIQGNQVFIENSYVYRILKEGTAINVVNLFNKQKYSDKQHENLKLNDEFMCNDEKGKQIREAFKDVQTAFPS